MIIRCAGFGANVRTSPAWWSKIIVASLVAAAITLYLTRTRQFRRSVDHASPRRRQKHGPARGVTPLGYHSFAGPSGLAAAMDPGYRSPLVDFFRRSESARDARLLAAQGALSTAALEQLALLVLLSDDEDGEIAATAQATIVALPDEPLRNFLAAPEVPSEIRRFFADRGVAPAAIPAIDMTEPLLDVPDDDDDNDLEEEQAEKDEEGQGGAGSRAGKAEPKILAGLPIKKKVKLASKGTREQRAQLIRDPNKLVAAAVLSSPKLTEAEVESFAKMANVAEEVLRVIGMNRAWLKNYGVVLGLVRNPKTPPAISMQLLQRINERDMKMLAVDRNVPEALRLAARKFIVKGLR